MYDSEGMTCQQCREVVSASLDEEAGAAERAAADAHLAGCVVCRAYEVDARSVDRLTRVRPAEQLPDIAGDLLASLGIAERQQERVPAAPELSCLPGGCCGSAPTGAPTDAPTDPLTDLGTAASVCGCLATCGCGCQDGAPCGCGISTEAA